MKYIALLFALFLAGCQTAPVVTEKGVTGHLDTTHRPGDVLPIQYACMTEEDAVYWSEHLGQRINQEEAPSCGPIMNTEDPSQPVVVMLAAWVSGGYSQGGQYGSLWIVATGNGQALYVAIPDLGGRHKIGVDAAPQESRELRRPKKDLGVEV